MLHKFFLSKDTLPIRWRYCWVRFNPVVSILYICIYINIQIYIHIDSSQGNIYTEHHHHQCTLARSHRRANWQLQVSCVLCSWLYGSCNKEQCCTCHGRMGHLIIVLLDQFGWYGWNWVQLITWCTSWHGVACTSGGGGCASVLIDQWTWMMNV